MDYKTQRTAVTMLLGKEEFSFLNVISPFYLIAMCIFFIFVLVKYEARKIALIWQI